MVTFAGLENLILGIGEFEVSEGKAMVASVRRTGSTANAITVDLTTSDFTEIVVPASVELAAGNDYVQFFVDARSDFLIDGTRQVAVIASADGYYPGRKTVDVIDDGKTVDGDFNDDGLYDCHDIDALISAIAQGLNDAAFDVTGDGHIDSSDRDKWLAEAAAVNGLALPYRLGDANLDGVVDVPDFNVWNANKFTTTAAWCQGDFTADGVIDVPDFNAWNRNKFTMEVPSDGLGSRFDGESAVNLSEPAMVIPPGLERRQLVANRRRELAETITANAEYNFSVPPASSVELVDAPLTCVSASTATIYLGLARKSSDADGTGGIAWSKIQTSLSLPADRCFEGLQV